MSNVYECGATVEVRTVAATVESGRLIILRHFYFEFAEQQKKTKKAETKKRKVKNY